MSHRKGYTLTITATGAPPALLMGAPASAAPQAFGPAFTIMLQGDLADLQDRRAGSTLDLAEETGGQLAGKARFADVPPKEGEVQLFGIEEVVQDQAGRRLEDGKLFVDKDGHVSELVACIWRD